MRFILELVFNKYIYRCYLRKKLNTVGEDFRLGYFSEINNPQYFSIGNNFYSGPFATFSTNKNNPVEIGDSVMFGPRCAIQGGNHDFTYEGFIRENKNINHMSGTIKLEKGVWVGANTTILSGALIREGSIIGAMSLVNKEIPPFVIAAGVPIKVIKSRFKTLTKLSNTLEFTQSDYTLQEIIELHKKHGITYS